MLFQYWLTAYGGGPTLTQHWVKSWCLLCMWVFGPVHHDAPQGPPNPHSLYDNLHSAMCPKYPYYLQLTT